jgi:hypothetical protein
MEKTCKSNLRSKKLRTTKRKNTHNKNDTDQLGKRTWAEIAESQRCIQACSNHWQRHAVSKQQSVALRIGATAEVHLADRKAVCGQQLHAVQEGSALK